MVATETEETRHDDDDVAINGDCKSKAESDIVPDDDSLDIYPSNSSVLCTVNVPKESDGVMIKRAMMKEVVSQHLLSDGVDPMCCRLSFEIKSIIKPNGRLSIHTGNWAPKRDDVSWSGSEVCMVTINAESIRIME